MSETTPASTPDDAPPVPPTTRSVVGAETTSDLVRGFGGENDILCALRIAEARGEFASTVHAAPATPSRKTFTINSSHRATTERSMGHIGPANGYFTSPRDNNPAPQNEYDALADLFLSHDEARTLLSKPAAPPAQPSFASSEGGPALRLHNTEPLPLAEETPKPNRRVERLIVGNLPAPANAWVAQYAKHIASAEHCTVGLTRISEGVTTVELVHPTGSPRPCHNPSHSLETCIQQASDVPIWLLRVESTNDFTLSNTHTSAGTTIFTGADDTSLVAAYRTLKSIAASTPRPSLRIAIVGADDSKSKSAEDKLRRGAQTFLGITLDHVTRIDKISPGSSEYVYESKPNAHSSISVLGALCNCTNAATQDFDRDAAATPSHLPVTPPSVAPSQSPYSAHSLTSDIQGLTRLPLTCPSAPSVEVAIELKPTSAQVHLLTSDTTNGPSALLLAASWVKANAQFLQLAAPSTPLTQGEPVLHIFTNDLRTSRPLLDTPIRVQFVVEFECNGESKRIVKQAN